MKKSSKIVIVFILMVAVLFAALAIIKVRKDASNKGEVVQIETPQRGELVEFVSAPGEIEPKTKVELTAKVQWEPATLQEDFN